MQRHTFEQDGLDDRDALIECLLGVAEFAQDRALPVSQRRAQGIAAGLDFQGDMARQASHDVLAQRRGHEPFEDALPYRNLVDEEFVVPLTQE